MNTLVIAAIILLAFLLLRQRMGLGCRAPQVETFAPVESRYLSDRCKDSQIHSNNLDKIVAIECDKQKRHPYYDNEINDRRLCRLYEDKSIYQNFNVSSWCSNLENPPKHEYDTKPIGAYQGPDVINDYSDCPRPHNSPNPKELNYFDLGNTGTLSDFVAHHEVAKMHNQPNTYDGRCKCSVYP